MHHACDICVVGNGAIGKAAALGFARAGRSVLLLAPDAGPAKASDAARESWDVRVYALNHVAQALLSSLMVWDALDASRVVPVEAMAIEGDGAQDAGKLGFDAYGARVGALAWIVEDRNLNAALDAALRFAPKVKQIAGRATALAQAGALANASTTLTLENGDTIASQLVVGADGAQSWLRGQCDIDYDFRSYNQRGVVANFECEKPHHGTAYQWFCGAEGIVALLPLPGKRVSLVWSAPDALAGQLLSESAAALAERLAPWAGAALGRLTPVQPESVKAFPLALLRPHAMTAPRVALAGDAAHVIHPLAGHGMNLGFGDVEALVKIIGEIGDCGAPRLLRRYARARKEDVLLMQLATDGLERLFASEAGPLRFIRNAGMNLLNGLPVVKRHLIAQALGRPAPLSD